MREEEGGEENDIDEGIEDRHGMSNTQFAISHYY
jgi:hypothetical protein